MYLPAYLIIINNIYSQQKLNYLNLNRQALLPRQADFTKFVNRRNYNYCRCDTSYIHKQSHFQVPTYILTDGKLFFNSVRNFTTHQKEI